MMNLSRTALFCLALACYGLPAALAAPPDDFQEARKFFSQGNYPKAMERVDALIAKNGKDARARFLKGVIYSEQNKSADAIKVFTALTEEFPELPEPYNNLAVLYAAQGQDESARRALEQAIRTHPTYATAHENLGDLYAKMARDAYDKALQLDSQNRTAKAKLALVKELFSMQSTTGEALVKTTVGDPTSTGPAVSGGPTAANPPPPSTVAETAKPEPNALAGPTGVQAEVIQAVQDWAKAWSSGEAESYLSYYAPDFVPSGGMGRKSWERSRRQRVVKNKQIMVDIVEPSAEISGADQAIVRFRQNYQSQDQRNSSMKKLTLRKLDGRWLITREQVGR